MVTHELQSLRLCISDVLHYKMARDEAQHGTFSEPTRTGIHTTTQRGTVPSCIEMVHRRKTHSVVVGGGETQQKLIPFKHNEMVGCRLGVVGVDGPRWVYGVRRHGARVKDSKDARGSSELVAYTLK